VDVLGLSWENVQTLDALKVDDDGALVAREAWRRSKRGSVGENETRMAKFLRRAWCTLALRPAAGRTD
jgi:hypothetical protein